jgi:Txe/YoeB family toxin of Txe-Axe toxin-antitoxin module
MNKTSYQVSDASIKRYWQLRKPKTIEEIEEMLKQEPIDIFKSWAKSENLSYEAYYTGMRRLCKADRGLLRDVIDLLKDKTEKLNKIADAFEIINDINS